MLNLGRSYDVQSSAGIEEFGNAVEAGKDVMGIRL